MLFRFRRTKQPQAGAESYAFQPATLNPLYTLFKGPGVAVMPPFSPVQPPPLYYPHPLGPTSGIGGLIYDANYFAPLMKATRR